MDSSPERRYSLDDLMPLIREALDGGRNVRFSPRGSSMLPMLRPGKDSVVFSPLPRKLRKYDLVLYQRSSGQYVLHRIIKAGPAFTCLGDHQLDPEEGLRREQMIALVMAFYREDRLHTVTEPGYRLYCRVWYWTRPLRHLLRRGRGWLRRHLP